MKGVYSFCLFCNCVCLFVCLFVCKLFFLSNISLMILKFGTKFDSDELYCVTKKKQPHIAHFMCSFFFLSNEISVTDISAPIGASVFKFCVHL